jgi:hypothetical protein
MDVKVEFFTVEFDQEIVQLLHAQHRIANRLQIVSVGLQQGTGSILVNAIHEQLDGVESQP